MTALTIVVSQHRKMIELDRSVPGRSRRYWIKRSYGSWNLRLPGLLFQTAEQPRWWLVSVPLTAAWWPNDATRLRLRIWRWDVR